MTSQYQSLFSVCCLNTNSYITQAEGKHYLLVNQFYRKSRDTQVEK